MDLVQMEKKAIFIPTPGQYEQEYLAKRFHRDGMIMQCKQEEFSLKKIESAAFYKGLPKPNNASLPSDLFRLFQGK